MSIKSITIGNFKGIRDKVKIDLKPVTLLFGKNSGGKSTIIQAIHYAYEVMVRHNLDPNFTELGGREIDLGGFENIVYAHDKTRSISLRFDLDLEDGGLPEYFDNEYYRVSNIDDDFEPTYMFCWNINSKDISSAWVEVSISWDEVADIFLVSRYEVGLNEQLIARVQASCETNSAKIQYINFLHPLLTKNQEDLKEAFMATCSEKKGKERSYESYERVFYLRDLIDQYATQPEVWLDPDIFPSEEYSKLSEIAGRAKALEVEISEEGKEMREKLRKMLEAISAARPGEKGTKESYLKEKMYEFWKNQEVLKKKYGLEGYDFYATFAPYEFLFFCLDRLGLKSITGDLDIGIGKGDALPKFEDNYGLSIETPASRKSGEKGMEHWYTEALRSAMSQFILGPGKILRDELKNFHYIGPIRSRIPRNYEPNRFVENSNWANGIAAWDVLHKEDEEFIGEVDEWLADRLKSGYRVTRKKYKEIDISGGDSGDAHSEEIMHRYNSAPTQTRLSLIDEKNGVEVQPPDVGTGISQLIPIIVGALYFKEGLVAIEQPELHIHPAFQVALGDLFIKQGTEKNISFLIETHSEHLLLRLLRRIRETHESELSLGITAFYPARLAIYYIERGDQGVRISQLWVSKDGDSEERWPEGFFEERHGELY